MNVKLVDGPLIKGSHTPAFVPASEHGLVRFYFPLVIFMYSMLAVSHPSSSHPNPSYPTLSDGFGSGTALGLRQQIVWRMDETIPPSPHNPLPVACPSHHSQGWLMVILDETSSMTRRDAFEENYTINMSNDSSVTLVA